jgi:hypothetical protein
MRVISLLFWVWQTQLQLLMFNVKRGKKYD